MTDLSNLRLMAEDQLVKANDRAPHHQSTLETRHWVSLIKSIEQVAEFAAETGEWVACLRCGLAFPNGQELSAHYNEAHR
jgi:hypothetical protein